MPQTDRCNEDGDTPSSFSGHRTTSHSPASPPLTESLKLPKNRSTGNLLAQAATAQRENKPRVRFSFDGASQAEMEALSKSPILTEHEHGLGASGLRRIRQQPSPRAGTLPTSEPSSISPGIHVASLPSSMNISLPSSRHSSNPINVSPGPASPNLNFGEDLYRFPSESLHSFSFAHQSEDSLYCRQTVLKRSVDFMRDRLSWVSNNSGIAQAQAKLSGDHEMQSVMELLSRAKLLEQGRMDGVVGLGLLEGPLTGPAEVNGANVFEKTFVPRSTSPDDMERSSLTDPVTDDSTGTDVTPARRSNADRLRRSAELADQSAVSSTSDNRGGEDSLKAEESTSTSHPSPPRPRKSSLRRTCTDTTPLALQNKLFETLSRPYIASKNIDSRKSPHAPSVPASSLTALSWLNPNNAAVHGHTSRWAPAAQAIFTTEATSPWTILAANDLACLVFGVTKAEVRKIGILEVVREERRSWLEAKLRSPGSDATSRRPAPSRSLRTSPTPTTTTTPSPWAGNGVTARLLSKPSWRDRRAQTDDGSGAARLKKTAKGGPNHPTTKSRGVLLCGDVVPIQKRNGVLGAASLWVKEKRGGLIWVLEEISEDVAYVDLNDQSIVTAVKGSTSAIWEDNIAPKGMDIERLVPHLPRIHEHGVGGGDVDYAKVQELQYFCARVGEHVYIPATVDRVLDQRSLRVSSFPHIAGMMVLSAGDLRITSSNSVFSAALFGQSKPDGLLIDELIPNFGQMLQILTAEDEVELIDGIVVPEHSFRRARAILALRAGEEDAAVGLISPSSLPALHRDGSEIKVDVQMRVVKSDSFVSDVEESIIVEEEDDDGKEVVKTGVALTEMVYALWITYSRHLHASTRRATSGTSVLSPLDSPPHQPSPGQTQQGIAPQDMDVDHPPRPESPLGRSPLSQQISEATSIPISTEIVSPSSQAVKSLTVTPPHKKSISDFVILEEMGQGAYGQVKLVRYRHPPPRKMVLKYVTKRRILVDTWTRDRRLGTVPLEIHVLDYLRRDGLRHPNIVEMSDFFEDDVNYYIEMVPHGLPGMDLFDYIELRVNMEEEECRSIFRQVADAIHHLHTVAMVVHRDIKDENVVMDGEGRIKLIDFGSAAYIRNGPFDVFVGTIDYAAPEVLSGSPYTGKPQDCWALGILLYTIVYKENPFYSIDEIMDHDLRVPYIVSEESIDLIRKMLDRDVAARITVEGVISHSWLKPGIIED